MTNFTHGKVVRVVERDVLTIYPAPFDADRLRVTVNAESLDDLVKLHTGVGRYLNENSIDVAKIVESPALDPEYVAEALRSTLRATSFEGGVGEDLVEDFIASYEKAVEEGARA